MRGCTGMHRGRRSSGELRTEWDQRGWTEPWTILKISAMVGRSGVCIKFAHGKWKRKRHLKKEDFDKTSFMLCAV